MSREAWLQEATERALPLIRELLSEAFDAGYKAALEKMLHVAKTEIALPIGRPNEISAPRRVRPGRPRHPARDEAIVGIIAAAVTPITQSEIRNQLAAQGDDAPMSSVGVVLKRLCARAEIRRVGRGYTLAERDQQN